MSKEDASNTRDRLGSWVMALVLFLLGAGLLFCAYVAIASGTVLKTGRRLPGSPRHSPPTFAGTNTQQEAPGRFWTMEIAFLGTGIVCTVGSVKILWDEYKSPRDPHSQ